MTIEDSGETMGHDPFDFSDLCDSLRDEVTVIKVNQLIEADEEGIEARISDDARFLGITATDTSELPPLKSSFHGMRGH